VLLLEVELPFGWLALLEVELLSPVLVLEVLSLPDLLLDAAVPEEPPDVLLLDCA
jgi:hypothetical protein